MFLLGNKRRIRLADMMATFCQIVIGAFFVSHFFKETPGYVGLVAIIFILITIILAVIIEPETKEGG